MLDLLKLDFLKGYRTYIIAGVIGVLAVVTALDYEIPAWVWVALNALGLGTLRGGIAGLKGVGK